MTAGPTPPGIRKSSAGSRLEPGSGARVVPRRHPGRWATTLVIVVLMAMFVNTLITNPRFEWGVVGDYLFSAPIIDGLKITLGLTAASFILGCCIGAVLAPMRMSNVILFRSISGAFIWVFRSIPQLVQLILIYNISALYPEISFGIPFGAAFTTVDANKVLTPFLVGLLGLGVHEGAYMAEIFRAGIISIPKTQVNAALALGMDPIRVARRVVAPQAMRVILPTAGNQLIMLVKSTSLVSVVAVSDLLYTAQTIYARTFQTIPLLLVAALWYLLLTGALSFCQGFLEKRYGRAFGIT